MTVSLATHRPPPLPQRVRVQRAEGAAAVAALIGREYARARLRPHGEHQWLRVTQVVLPHTRLDRLSSRVTAELTLEPTGAWHVGRVDAGRLTVLADGRSLAYGPGQMYVWAPNRRLRVQWEDAHLDLALIDPALLGEVARAAGAALPAADVESPPTAQATAVWCETWQHVRKTVTADPAAPPVVVDAAERLLLAATLGLWARSTGAEPPQAEAAQYPETLRRAIAFLEVAPERDITVEDIAEAACVTVRAVQMAFRRHLNTTPMGYLRMVRLARAHAELQHGATDRTVGSIARRWGFGNAGRFAAAYRAAYGAKPHVTLRTGVPSR